jgi:hypothetical protein
MPNQMAEYSRSWREDEVETCSFGVLGKVPLETVLFPGPNKKAPPWEAVTKLM